jgi:hypothetical protein
MISRLLARQMALCCLVVSCASVAARADDAAALVQKGFYLQIHEGDPAAAAAIFEQVASDSSVPANLRSEAQTRLAQCREDVAAADLARLMPPESIAYVELNQPGEQVVRLAKMMGLVREPGTEPPATNGQPAPGLPLGPGLVFPADFTVSPALAAELKKFRGAALAVTDLDQKMQKMPEGVLVIHPGDSDLVRGLLETAVQLIEPSEPIAGFKSYRFHDHHHEFWLTVTKRLLIAGTKREAVAATVERLGNPKSAGLAGSPAFKAHEAERRKGLLFAYVDGHETARRLRSAMKGHDAAMIASLLDLEHLESLTLAAGVTDDGVEIVGRMNLKPGHHNVAYNLIRTAPFTGRSLNSVPNGTAGVVLIGLNPATPAPTATPGTVSQPVEVTGMDIGREIFANIEEVAFFVLPTATKSADSHTPLPAMAAVFAVKDPAKSEELWNTILSIVAMAGMHDTHPRDVTIEGTPGRLYHFKGAPPIAVVRSPERELIVGTEDAAGAALRASRSHDSIKTDAAYGKVLAKLTPTSSKAVLVDAGRAMQIARTLSGGGHSSDMDLAVVAVKDLRVSLVTDEARDSLTIRIQASGLPNVPSIIKMLATQPHSTAKK